MASERPPQALRTEYAPAPLGVETERPRFGWRPPDGTDQSGYHVRVATSRAALAEGRADAWDSGAVASDRTTHVAYDGAPLDPATRYHWVVRVDDGDGFGPWSDPATFETGLPESAWDADWVAGPPSPGDDPAPAPLLRTDFDLDGTVERARAYVAAAGYCDLHVNGERVGEQVLDTAHTDYEERVLYAVHDVTDALRAGANAVGATLGRDWYALTTENVWGWERAPWTRNRPRIRLQLEVTFADGTTRTVATDDDWRTTDGPTRFDSIYAGEVYDAREAVPGWATPDFDDADWDCAAVVDGPDGALSAQQVEPMRVVDRLEPVAVEESDAGTAVFDFGEVTAGWAELSVAGPRGTEVELVYGERLHDDGTVDVEQHHVEGAIQTDTYVLAGDGTETWTPRFSYKGFRYVEVRGLPGDPTADALTAEVVHTAIETDSESRFECANDLLNRVHDGARRTVLNNCHGVPTDTPVFEKNGWTGDAQVGAEMAAYNFDVGRFLTKWLDDFADAQRPDGEVPPIVPTSDWGYSDRPMDGGINSPNPGWDAAYVFLPWWAYRYCGDRRLLAEHYDGMCALVDWTGTYAEDGVLDVGLGDWLSPSHEDEMRGLPPEGPAITSTAYYHRMARTVADAAAVLGHDDDSEAYAALAADVRDALNDAFLDRQAGVYATGEADEYRQTSTVFPLAFDIVPDACREAVVERLVADVRDTHDRHLNTGFHGTKYLLPVLTEAGHLELAYDVATQTTYPSWGHWIAAHGATTSYEAWELSSRSRDHYAFGAAADEWLYRYLAGVRPAEPGFRRVEVAPHVPADLDSVTATVDTVRGPVSVAWAQGDRFELDVSVPPATDATVRVPRLGGGVRVGGAPAEGAAGVAVRGRDDDRLSLDVGPGDWSFTV
jgi:alpha-L-rhamnosidase